MEEEHHRDRLHQEIDTVLLSAVRQHTRTRGPTNQFDGLVRVGRTRGQRAEALPVELKALVPHQQIGRQQKSSTVVMVTKKVSVVLAQSPSSQTGGEEYLLTCWIQNTSRWRKNLTFSISGKSSASALHEDRATPCAYEQNRVNVAR